MAATTISPHHKAIAQYRATLEQYASINVEHEMATRSAFQTLLNTFAPSAGWIVIPEQPLPNGKRPDATLRDAFTFPRGYWEAKDTHDNLGTEIQKKITSGYPTLNTIFEDTNWAVLYQSGKEVERFDLHKPQAVADLLTQFFNFAEAPIESFELAVQDFKDRIPDLAQGLLGLIQKEHEENKAFRDAFAGFYSLCTTSLDPKISAKTIQEMLVQHLLTERLFRTVFNNPDFTHRNVIAAEIENVIDALTSRSFNRAEFLRSLDRFYIAIERAAQRLEDWSEKQAFMNVVYERFFQGWSLKEADTHGIVYTPQEIVDFMCGSVEDVLQREFGRSLSDIGVEILDPATGTGSFIVNLLRRISRANLEFKYQHDLFANEVMLLPYYIASLNIEHAYYERTGKYLSFEGLCFTDTLELAERLAYEGLGEKSLWVTERNTERVEREKDAPIMVVIGNPPYNVGQSNENDNNKNRKHPVIDGRIKATYAKDSRATLSTMLYDAYVKFFRWATDRLQGRDGMVCFVSNNSFVDQIAFDGMRRHLLQDFTCIYHLDLHGNVRRNPKLSGTTHNVFGIQVGVGITIAVRRSTSEQRGIYYYRVPEEWRKEQKLAFLTQVASIGSVEWQELKPDERATWLTEGMRPEFASFLPIGNRESKASRDTTIGGLAAETIFKAYSLGVKTGRDQVAYDFNAESLGAKVAQYIEDYNAEVSRWVRAGRPNPEQLDDFVHYDKVKWSRNLKRDLRSERYITFNNSAIRKSFYRPFTLEWLYYADGVADERGTSGSFFPTPATEAENAVIVVSDHGFRSPFSVLAVNAIPDLHLLASTDGFQCFPFYTYAGDGSLRNENITNWALLQFQHSYGNDVSKRDIFDYVYGLLHHDAYRGRYVDNLKRELPRIPLLPNRQDFEMCRQIGATLSQLHLSYEHAPEFLLALKETPAHPIDWKVTKMRLTRDKTALVYNEWLTLEGIPAEASEYRLGNRSALGWVIDQYQVSTDDLSRIKSDPNRSDDPEYIVRLVKQVVTVSVETVRLVKELAQRVSLDKVVSA